MTRPAFLHVVTKRSTTRLFHGALRVEPIDGVFDHVLKRLVVVRVENDRFEFRVLDHVRGILRRRDSVKDVCRVLPEISDGNKVHR